MMDERRYQGPVGVQWRGMLIALLQGGTAGDDLFLIQGVEMFGGGFWPHPNPIRATCLVGMAHVSDCQPLIVACGRYSERL